MHTQKNLTVPPTALRAGLYMVWSSPSVVAISINGFYCSSMNNRESSLTIYVKAKIFQGSHTSTKVFYFEFYY